VQRSSFGARNPFQKILRVIQRRVRKYNSFEARTQEYSGEEEWANVVGFTLWEPRLGSDILGF